MWLRSLSLCVMALAAPAGAQEVSYRFVWEGGGGYALTGALAFDPAAVAGPYVRETDLTCFVIEGQKDGAPIGRWALTMLLPETTWRLHFHAPSARFPVDGDDHELWMPQAWNMNGEGRDCGPGGFGFNAGNYAQDLCLDGALLRESQRPPDQPFAAQRAEVAFPPDACRAPPMLSDLRPDPAQTLETPVALR